MPDNEKSGWTNVLFSVLHPRPQPWLFTLFFLINALLYLTSVTDFVAMNMRPLFFRASLIPLILFGISASIVILQRTHFEKYRTKTIQEWKQFTHEPLASKVVEIVSVIVLLTLGFCWLALLFLDAYIVSIVLTSNLLSILKPQ